ncbi:MULTISPECIES: hypothetical protein [unclassified Mycolicibacterium]|uniref:hypothetical protein n=1 Tax=unclassified Mycolicibacterium TaxID=2636767 RepID=UPI001BB44686|nr:MULTISPECIES: hypothetical protein [unclassified Mycolicibacterium]BCJ79631.1 hypothetical protein MTY81_10040 [Mycolicibacterium sp. TY81]
MRHLGMLAAVLVMCAFSACSVEKTGEQKVSAETAAAFGDVTLPQGAQVLATATDAGRDTRYRLSLRLTDSQLREFLGQFPAQPRPSEIPKTITVLAGPSPVTASKPLFLQDKVTTKDHKLVNREVVVDERGPDEVYVHLSLYTT